MPLCTDERSVQVLPPVSKSGMENRNKIRKPMYDTTGQILLREGTQLDDDCCWEFVDENVDQTLDLTTVNYQVVDTPVPCDDADNTVHGTGNMRYPNYPQSTYQEYDDNSGYYQHYAHAKSFENPDSAPCSPSVNDQSAPTTSQHDATVPDAWKAEMENLEPYPPNKIFEKIDIHPVKGKGRCAFALIDFEPGEVIFVELPILVATPSLDQSLYDSLKEIHEQSPLSLPPMWHLAALYSVMRLPPEKKSILMDKWVPTSRIIPSDDVLKVLYNTKLKVDPNMYERFLQVWRFNSFGHHAAPEDISMLSHSCNATASWHYGSNEAFTLRARQKIEKGSEISISYIGDEDLFKATHVRQEKLSGWLFVCACERCAAPHDHSRGFRCTSCGVGTVFLKTTKEPNEHVSAEATFSSHCSLCDDTPSKDDIRQYITVENAYAERIDELNANLLEDSELLYAEAQRVFVQHWLLHQLNGILVEGYKKRSRFAEASELQLKRVEYVQHACPRISYTLAWLFEELGDMYSQRWNISMTESLVNLPQHQRNTLAMAYETAMNMLIILCGSCHDYTLVAYKMEEKPKVLIIATGGTICMVNDGHYNSLRPSAFIAKELQKSLENEFMPKCVVHEWDTLIDSSDITLEHWVRLTQEIEKNYDEYNGFVILHGTDTLAYTASVLSFMLEYLSKPVIITGAMLPIHHIQSDALINVAVASMIAAYATLPEVCVLFGSKLFRGNRTTKVDCFKKDAFRSPNFPPLGHIGVDIKINDTLLMLSSKQKLSVFTNLNMNILILHVTPQFNVDVVEHMLSNIQLPFGLILRFFGSGTAPSLQKKLLDTLEKAIKRGVTVLIVTQCFKGACSLLTYENGSRFYNIGVIEGKDMTTEAAFAKLAYLLGKGYTGPELRTYMEMELRGEITEKFSKVTGQLSIIENDHLKPPGTSFIDPYSAEIVVDHDLDSKKCCDQFCRVHAEAHTFITLEHVEEQERGSRNPKVPQNNEHLNAS